MPETPDDKDIHKFPYRLMFILIAAWFVLGLVPLGLVWVGTHKFPLATAEEAAVAGTIGDAFGLVNSFFSGLVMLLVLLSLRLQRVEMKDGRAEWRANTASQRDQADMMRQAARLSAINNIYTHYSAPQGASDSPVRLALAKGHRNWAVREMFDSIDSLFREDRVSQMTREASQLAELLMTPRSGVAHLEAVAFRVANQLVDERLMPGYRASLWRLYDILRTSDTELLNPSSLRFTGYCHAAREVVDAWHQTRT